MVDHDAALAHHLLKIAIAYPVAARLPDRLKNGFTLEVAALEVGYPILPFSRGDISSNAYKVCNRAERNVPPVAVRLRP